MTLLIFHKKSQEPITMGIRKLEIRWRISGKKVNNSMDGLFWATVRLVMLNCYAPGDVLLNEYVCAGKPSKLISVYRTSVKGVPEKKILSA